MVSSIKSGSETAFRQLYQLFHQKLYFYFLQKTRSEDTSEELVQLTFIKLWRFRDSLDPAITLSHQLFRIAKTSFIDTLRKKANNRVVSLDIVSHADMMEPPSVLLQEDNPIAIIQESLSHLPPERRKIMTCRLQGLTNKEIADHFSISKKTVENQVNRAVRDLRKLSTQTSVLLLILSSFRS